ncbi:hypothetical protein [Deinococcus hopiensis]|uniref:Uncharacterized protein n=1 Tax=Deinococcus hopiensis KR-140 TaxID=695939 RepID=A0A1W1VJX2_9DEIO|nr:hypothetical protein [Deinococcus hopiensis]SMB93361.1 hypothetical protein SAMN00790413_01952 [Deinococcus hopiensis KR-140]
MTENMEKHGPVALKIRWRPGKHYPGNGEHLRAKVGPQRLLIVREAVREAPAYRLVIDGVERGRGLRLSEARHLAKRVLAGGAA